MVKVVHVSSSDLGGGAHRAAYRLHTGLQVVGCESSMLVQEKLSADPSVRVFTPPTGLRYRIARAWQRRRIVAAYRTYNSTRPSGFERFHSDRSEYGASPVDQILPADIVHLHFVARFLDLPTTLPRLAAGAPLVWTAHDMGPFTGGCPYDFECGRFEHQCGKCPQLGSNQEIDLSSETLRRKIETYQKLGTRLHVVVASRWMEQVARRSAVLQHSEISFIPYGLDMTAFKPCDRATARAALGIPQEAHVILFAAVSVQTRRKGFALLDKALAGLKNRTSLHLISMGKDPVPTDSAIPHMHLGFLEHPTLLSLAYSAADLFVIPSLAEAFGQTALEAIACGTPVVGFKVGGIPDIVRPGLTGELADPGKVESLRGVIQSLLDQPEKRAAMAQHCRRIAVEEYSTDIQAKRYLKLYESLRDARPH